MIVETSGKLPMHSFKIRCTIGPIRLVIRINIQQIVGYSLAVHRYSEYLEYLALSPLLRDALNTKSPIHIYGQPGDGLLPQVQDLLPNR